MTGKPLSAEKMAKILEISTLQVDRLTRLIEDLLDVSRIQSGKLSFQLEYVDLTELLQDVLERYRDPLADSNCELRVALEPGVRALVDRGRVEQVIVNLLSNAIKYAPGTPLEIELKKEDGVARISVRDNGPGIGTDEKSRIFERFGRAAGSRNIGGLGLGLFISRQIIEAHGGTIEVNSQPGQGSEFVIVLPLKPARRPMVDTHSYTAQSRMAEK